MRRLLFAASVALVSLASPTAVAPGCAGTVTEAMGNYLVVDGLDEYVYAESNGMADLQRGGSDVLGVADACQSSDAPDTLLAARPLGTVSLLPPGAFPAGGAIVITGGGSALVQVLNPSGFACGPLSWDGVTAEVSCNAPATPPPPSQSWVCFWNSVGASATGSGTLTVQQSCGGLPTVSCTASAPNGCITPYAPTGPGLFPVTCKASLSSAATTTWWVAVCVP